jgi:hypothetical protein
MVKMGITLRNMKSPPTVLEVDEKAFAACWSEVWQGQTQVNSILTTDSTLWLSQAAARLGFKDLAVKISLFRDGLKGNYGLGLVQKDGKNWTPPVKPIKETPTKLGNAKVGKIETATGAEQTQADVADYFSVESQTEPAREGIGQEVAAFFGGDEEE